MKSAALAAVKLDLWRRGRGVFVFVSVLSVFLFLFLSLVLAYFFLTYFVRGRDWRASHSKALLELRETVVQMYSYFPLEHEFQMESGVHSQRNQDDCESGLRK